MITYHPSVDGSADYLDFHTPDYDRLFLPRHEMRAYLQRLRDLAETVPADAVCEHCGRPNGVHRISVDDAGDIQRCEGASAGGEVEMTQLDELVQDGQLSIDAARVSLGLQPLGLPETGVPSKRDAPRLDVALTVADPEPPPGTTIEMESGQRWTRYPDMWPGSWLVERGEADSDPETWLKVAGNYGPVRIVRSP